MIDLDAITNSKECVCVVCKTRDEAEELCDALFHADYYWYDTDDIRDMCDRWNPKFYTGYYLYSDGEIDYFTGTSVSEFMDDPGVDAVYLFSDLPRIQEPVFDPPSDAELMEFLTCSMKNTEGADDR